MGQEINTETIVMTYSYFNITSIMYSGNGLTSFKIIKMRQVFNFFG